MGGGARPPLYETLHTVPLDNLTYPSLQPRVLQSPSRDGVSDVEGMVIGRTCRVVPSFNDEEIVLASLHLQLWSKDAIDVPGYAPACST